MISLLAPFPGFSSIPTASTTIFLMDGHLLKTRGGKKRQIRLMVPLRFSLQRHR
jgi:hypothetical protein